jgi:hypothetical protein
LGSLSAGPAIMETFCQRDVRRKRARQMALAFAALAGLAALLTLEILIPSAANLPFSSQGFVLSKYARQVALLGLAGTVAGLIGFIVKRRDDVGFQKLTLPLERQNEIWRLTIKVELAFRALARNEEARRAAEQRLEFVQAEVGAKFDRLCEPLIVESAALSTIDSTARLQMDVGHIFKRYADFHRRLAEARHSLCQDVMSATNSAVQNLLENQLPGQELRRGDDEVKVSISHPVLADTLLLQKRRHEWDETMRSIVSIGAETGNQIIGDWLNRAARGEITREEMPLAVEALRTLSHRSGPGAAKPLKALGPAQPGEKPREQKSASGAHELGFAEPPGLLGAL